MSMTLPLRASLKRSMLTTAPALLAVLLAAGCGGLPSAGPAGASGVNSSAATTASSATAVGGLGSAAAVPRASGDPGPIPVLADDAQWGDPTAPVTLVGFVQPEQPASWRAMQRLQQTQDPAKVRIVYKFLLHPSNEAAWTRYELAVATTQAMGGSGASLEFLRLVGNDATARTTGAADPLDLGALALKAKQAGIADTEQWQVRVTNARDKQYLTRSSALAKVLGMNGETGGYAVNGQMASSGSYDALSTLIEKEARKAGAKLDRGALRENLYAELCTENLKRQRDGEGDSDAVVAGPATGGLQITDTTIGNGATVKSGDSVTVHYTGTLTDGTVFDSSRPRGEPFVFQVGKGMVIKGWEKGLIGMKVGGVRKLVIPASLGYGARGVGKIPPNATLQFEIELLDTK
jgi:FKBP-type peptidyl-prolyl cis-trans isomerase FkpA